jgi:hypothetical protein
MLHEEPRAYPYIIKENNKETIFLWVTTPDTDGFVLDETGCLYSAKNIEDAKKTFHSASLSIYWNEAGYIDIDDFWREINKLSLKNTINQHGYNIILDGIDFIEDMLKTLFLPDEYSYFNNYKLRKIYKKIFYANNLEAVTPVNSEYEPIWSTNEIRNLRTVLVRAWEDIARKLDSCKKRTPC